MMKVNAENYLRNEMIFGLTIAGFSRYGRCLASATGKNSGCNICCNESLKLKGTV
jgi:hypothetical protein